MPTLSARSEYLDTISLEPIMLIPSLQRALPLLVLAASSAAAQTASPPARSQSAAIDLLRRSSFAVSVIQSRPRDAFSQHVGLGYGFDAAYLYRLDDAGVWSIRASAGVASYGNETRRTPFSETVGGRVTVNVRTANYIVPASIGPQIGWPTGPVRPYVNAGIGGMAFFTESTVQGTGDYSPIASTVNHSSAVGSWTLGSGLYMPLSVRAVRVDVDLGAQYFGGGRTRYLSRGSIVDLPNAQIRVTPLESTTHVTIVRLGARVHL